MNINKCPKCDRVISTVSAEPVEIALSRSDRYRGHSYSCPHCESVLSIQMNPLTLKDDIIGEIQTSLEQLAGTLETDISKNILAGIEEKLNKL